MAKPFALAQTCGENKTSKTGTTDAANASRGTTLGRSHGQAPSPLREDPYVRTATYHAAGIGASTTKYAALAATSTNVAHAASSRPGVGRSTKRSQATRKTG